ncbi:hypothetical protein ZWY2020_039262 [Hordeum vulgare]|nr:hypothetical protein ZWY2020_039262 [Hordeum vulgare]
MAHGTDLKALIVKEYDGAPASEMVSEHQEIWVQSMISTDKRTQEFGTALGNWLGKVVRVDVDEEGKAKGQHLRVRAQISVFEPLVRGFSKSSWRRRASFSDFHYEKVPHFCFGGRLSDMSMVSHDPPVDLAISKGGGWLRASSDKHGGSKGGSEGGGGGSNNSLGNGRQGDSNQVAHRMNRARDLPTKSNLDSEFSCTGDSRTGEEYRPGETVGRSPLKSRDLAKEQHEGDLHVNLELRREEVMRGKLVGQQRQRERIPTDEMSRVVRGQRSPPNDFHVDGSGRRMEGISTSCLGGTTDRRKGRYVRKPRQEYRPITKSSARRPGEDDNRKRRPKQLWVAKNDPDR